MAIQSEEADEIAIPVPEVWSSDDEGSEKKMAIPIPEVWSSASDDEGNASALVSHSLGSTAADSPVVKATLERLRSIESHNVAPRHLADPSSEGAERLRLLGADVWQPTEAQRCDVVEYDDAVGASAASFVELYISGIGRPCLVKNVPAREGWAAHDRWRSTEAFLQRYGSVPVQVTEMGSALGGKAMRLELPLTAFAEYARQNQADWPYYSWERQWDGPRSELLADFSVPTPFADDLYDLNEETREFLPLSCHLFVLVGGPRSGSNMHTDPKWSSAWNTILCGRKRWVLFPPDALADPIGAGLGDYKSAGAPAYWWLDHYPRLRAEGNLRGMVDLIQSPGDTLFIPSGWWHAVLNLPDEDGVTVCCTRNCLLPQNIPRVWPLMNRTSPDFARRFAEHIRKLRPDVAALLPCSEDVTSRPLRIGEPDWCIERRHFSELSLKECRESYISRGRPLIITGLGDAFISDACRGLSREFLRREFGMKVVAVRRSFARNNSEDGAELLTIDQFCERLDAGEQLYLYDVSLPLQLPTLLPYVRVPRYFAHCRLQRTRMRHVFDRSWPTLFIGAAGTHSRLHVDQWHSHFWMTLVSGTKKWSAWHPNDAHLLSPSVVDGCSHPTFPDLEALQDSPTFARARRIDFTLHAGETLFIPGGAPHYVTNDEDSVAFAGNFLDESNYEAALADLRSGAAREIGPGSPISALVSALEEVDWEDSEVFHAELLPAEHLAVPYSEFCGGAAAAWPAIPPDW